MGHGGFKVQVQQRNVKASCELPGEYPWKRWKTKSVSTFPRHGCCYLFVFKHDICCTRNLNVPTQIVVNTRIENALRSDRDSEI